MGIALLSLSTALLRADEIRPDDLLAHYDFNDSAMDRTGRNADWDLENTRFEGGCVFLNGRYEYYASETEKGFRATVALPGMNPRQFTLVIRFMTSKAHQGAGTLNLVSASQAHRWFGLRLNSSEDGKLLVNFNNGDFSQRIEGCTVLVETWTTIACAVDLPRQQIVIYQDGLRAGEILLPRDFAVDILNDPENFGPQNDLSFTNYSNGSVFHGWVDDLKIYNAVLSADELVRLTE